MLEKEPILSPTEKNKIDDVLLRLSRHEPIQYILGETEFFGLRLFVDKNVLIPRPETEELIELIIEQNEVTSPYILDIGTGSGCIAITLSSQIENASVSAWDISPTALSVAGRNADLNNTTIDFRVVDILSDYVSDKTFDIIVSNPPYVLESDKQNMTEDVLDYEPHIALFIPDNKALLFYERIADIALDLLNPNGTLYFEIHHKKGDETVQLLLNKGYKDVSLHKDISGNDRMIEARLNIRS